MARDLGTDLSNAVIAPVVAPAFFFKAEFDSGDVLAWSGYGDITWGGDTYLGIGDFGGVDKVDETSDVRANGVTLTLSGIPSQLLAIALLEPYQGRPCTLFLGALNLTTGVLVGTPYPLISGRMDVMTIEEGADTGTITLTVENRLIELFRTKERRYTHEDQQIDFPGDLGLEYVAGLQEKPINWGVANAAQATLNGGTAVNNAPPSTGGNGYAL
jgi:hypothetical protein